MAIRWKIPFKTLRSKVLLTANVYDDTFSGTAMVLKGAAQPFETQEKGSDDIFTPVRLQSGYLRIVDNGLAADGTTTFNWRDFIPTSDTDRPVTLTDANNNVLWQGFLQSQNFGATLFGNPQTREFPIQCSLSVTQGIDINFSQKEIKNFAYLLKQVIDSIPSTCRPTNIVVQGDAILWLSKDIDWQLFVDEDEDYTAIAKYKVYECLEEMCKFWGWTARTAGQTLYLLCPDDASLPRIFTFTYAQLSTLADNGSVEVIPSSFASVAISDGFANDDNKDYQMRGASKATFGINTDSNKEAIELFDHRLEVAMEDKGWTYGVSFGDTFFAKTGDIYNVDRTGFFAAVYTTHLISDNPASFNRLKQYLGASAGYGYGGAFNVIMFKHTYASGSPAYLAMQTKYMHSFSDGFFRFLGDTYVGADKYEEGDFYAGNWDMITKFGIGTSRSTAKWWDGRAWSSTEVSFRLTLGNKKPELFSRYVTGSGTSIQYEETSIINTDTLYGYIYLEFFGSENMPETDGQRAFNIGDFRLEFTKNNTVKKQQYPNSGWYDIVDKEIERKAYKSENANAIFDEYSTESIFASEKVSEPNFAIVLAATGGYLSTLSYNGSDEHPEQHFVNRVTSYWATSKRKIEANLLTHDGSAATDAASVTPKHMVEIDGTTMHPVAISHKWWDDEVEIVMMECVTSTPTVSHTISANAANTSLNGLSTSVSDGASWQGVLTPNTGYSISSVVILMGENDITSTAYNSSTGQIYIASVTGNVVITAVAQELPYDAEVEYLGSNGTPWIDTGLYGDKDLDYEVTVQRTGPQQFQNVLGDRYSSSSRRYTLMLDATSSSYSAYFHCGNSNTQIRPSASYRSTDFVTYKKSGLDVYIGSSKIGTFPSQTFTTPNTIILFGARDNGSFSSPFYGNISAAKFYDEGTLVRNFIPVRKDGVGYLYDKVSGQLFGNANSSGSFSYGPDKNS